MLPPRRGRREFGCSMSVISDSCTWNTREELVRLREHVVDHVILNDTMENVATDEAKVTIDSAGSTLDECPFFGLIMRSLWVGVVNVCDSNCGRLDLSSNNRERLRLTDPVVHPEVRQTVCQHDGPASDAFGGEVKRTHSDSKSEVAQGDERGLRRREDVSCRIQMTLLVSR